MSKRLTFLLATTAIISGCSLAPDFKLPDLHLPDAFKEQAKDDAKPAVQGNWKKAEPLAKSDRGEWWKIFGDEKLNELEKQALEANQSLKVAAARVQESRGTAGSYTPSLLPDISIGANALRTQPANASLAAFGQKGASLKPYNIYSAQGSASYEADLFGSVRDNYRALENDADAQSAAYRNVLLALQADVAQNYFALRALDSERKLLRDTVDVREKAQHIMQRRFDAGDAGQQDMTRTMSELSSSRADLISLDRSHSIMEHAMAVLLGKMPSEFTLTEAPLASPPPQIPPGLPSTLLERRPDIAAAQFNMEAANRRIGVARSAFFPSIDLTASGGFESIALADLFKWSSRTWALGQLAGTAISMPIFDSGRNLARLDVAHAAYDESVANYRQQVLLAFRDVEDNLVNQKLLAEQSYQQDAAASASARTMDVIEKRYKEGDTDFFEVVNAERDSLAAGRAAVQVRGQRFATTIALIRALGGGWDTPDAETKTVETPLKAEAKPEAKTEVKTETKTVDSPAQPPSAPSPVAPVTLPSANVLPTTPLESDPSAPAPLWEPQKWRNRR